MRRYRIVNYSPQGRVLQCHQKLRLTDEELLNIIDYRLFLLNRPLVSNHIDREFIANEKKKCFITKSLIREEDCFYLVSCLHGQHSSNLLKQKIINNYLDRFSPRLPIWPGAIIDFPCFYCYENYLNLIDSYSELGLDIQLNWNIDQTLCE